MVYESSDKQSTKQCFDLEMCGHSNVNKYRLLFLNHLREVDRSIILFKLEKRGGSQASEIRFIIIDWSGPKPPTPEIARPTQAIPKNVSTLKENIYAHAVASADPQLPKERDWF